MKQRVITAAIMIAVCLPLLVISEFTSKILAFIVLLLGTIEYVRNTVEDKSLLFYIMSSILTIVSFLGANNDMIDRIIAPIIIIVLFGFNVYNEKLDVLKISYLYLMYRTLTIGINCFINIRCESLSWVIYLLFVTYLTDSFALIGGMKFGKHKLNERISPKKTIEGAFCGYLAGALFGVVFAIATKTNVLLLPSLFIPIISQLGDLAFSSIKRYFKIKDFSNIFPGHGGMLDRIDSLIFSLITLTAFLAMAAL